MATLEAIRGGGGSVRVGAVGTISSLMTRELESSKTANVQRVSHVNGPVKPRKSMEEATSSSSSSNSKHTNPEVVRKSRGQKPNHVPVISLTTPKRSKQKTPLEDVGNNTVRQEMSKKSPNSSGKTRSQRSSSQIPMLGSENIHLEKTPVRVIPMKKGLNIVDVVDIRCGSGNPSISDRLRKLGFSKLSRSFM